MVYILAWAPELARRTARSYKRIYKRLPRLNERSNSLAIALKDEQPSQANLVWKQALVLPDGFYLTLPLHFSITMTLAGLRILIVGPNGSTVLSIAQFSSNFSSTSNPPSIHVSTRGLGSINFRTYGGYARGNLEESSSWFKIILRNIAGNSGSKVYLKRSVESWDYDSATLIPKLSRDHQA